MASNLRQMVKPWMCIENVYFRCLKNEESKEKEQAALLHVNFGMSRSNQYINTTLSHETFKCYIYLSVRLFTNFHAEPGIALVIQHCTYQ